MTEAWHVVQTNPRAEPSVQDGLVDRGFDVFLPQYWKKRSHARRIDKVKLPLFPCYLFVLFEATRDPWRSINTTRGVLRLICDGEKPCRLPDAVVPMIRAKIGPDGIIPMDAISRFEKGQTLAVNDGPFIGNSGIFQGEDRGRVVVLLQFLGQSVKVTLDDHQVAATG